MKSLCFNKKNLVLLIFSLMFCYSNAQIWQRIGGPGAPTSKLTHTNNHIFSISLEGIYSSSNGGQYWDRLPIVDNSVGLGFSSIAGNEDKLYLAVSGGGAFYSSDEGMTWDTITYGTSLVISEVELEDSLICFFGFNTLVISKDKGITWTTQMNTIQSVVSAAAIKGKEIAYHQLNVLHVSTNSGDTFVDYSNNPLLATTRTLWLDRNIILAGTYYGLVISTDTGAVFNQVGDIPTTTLVSEIFEENGTLYLASSTGIYSSVNSGFNWTRIDTVSTPVVFSLNGDLFASHNWISKSTNGGASWNYSADGISETQAGATLVVGNGIFAGVNGGVFYSADNGTTWQVRNYELSLGTGSIDFAQMGRFVFFANSTTVYRTEDYGFNWDTSGVGLPIGNPVYQFFVYDSLIFANCNTILYVSADSGNTWQSSSSGLPTNYIQGIIRKGNELFCFVNNNGLYKSLDGGQTWTGQSSPLPMAIDNLTTNGSMIACSERIGHKMYYTFDDGLTWDSSRVNLSTLVISDIQFINGNLMVACYGELYTTNDTGQTWNNVFYDLLYYNNDYIEDIFGKDNFIFANTRRSGFWRTDTTSLYVSVPAITSNSSLFIYPNPVIDNLTIKIPDRFSGNEKIKIFNSIGKTVAIFSAYANPKENSEQTINVSNLSSGIYFIQTTNEKGSLVTRFVKE